jgi:phosphatidate cytidylyltransferase
MNSNLIKRLITAIILIPLTIIGLFYLTPPWFCILTGLLSLAAALEWTNLMGVKSIYGRAFYLLIAAIIFTWILFISVQKVFLAAFIWWIIAAILVMTYPKSNKWWNKGVVARGMMGLFVIAPCWAALNFMRNQNDGILAILFLFVLIWGADSAAYFTGKKWGKTKLAALVSPGKSTQGCYGALIFSALITLLVLWLGGIPRAIWSFALILSLVTVIFSILGDLFESMMKREVGLKDSGRLLPGHGGLLDRIDSLTAAAPIFVLGGLVLGLYLE